MHACTSGRVIRFSRCDADERPQCTSATMINPFYHSMPPFPPTLSLSMLSSKKAMQEGNGALNLCALRAHMRARSRLVYAFLNLLLAATRGPDVECQMFSFSFSWVELCIKCLQNRVA